MSTNSPNDKAMSPSDEDAVAEHLKMMEEYKQKLDSLAKAGIPLPERTNNKTGRMFYIISESADHWLSSLPTSEKPLLDAGAAYGVHTLHAMRAGRDVLALDCDEVHIAELKRRAAKLVQETPENERKRLGKLTGTVFAKLPESTALEKESVSGVLLSEVLHFLYPGQILPIFRDVSSWLQPGGLLVATMGSFLPRAGTTTKPKDVYLYKNRTKEEALQCLQLPDEELVEAAPGCIFMNENSQRREFVGDHLYLFCIEELAAFCRMAGLVVEKAVYVSLGKYPTKDPIKEPETVLLVARKPKS